VCVNRPVGSRAHRIPQPGTASEGSTGQSTFKMGKNLTRGGNEGNQGRKEM
jgi:hypothetical protein